MKAIFTRFIPCTNTKGSRIAAFDSDNNRVTIAYNHSAKNDDRYREAAIALVHKMNWAPVVLAEGGTKEGSVFVMLPAQQFAAVALADNEYLFYVAREEVKP